MYIFNWSMVSDLIKVEYLESTSIIHNQVFRKIKLNHIFVNYKKYKTFSTILRFRTYACNKTFTVNTYYSGKSNSHLTDVNNIETNTGKPYQSYRHILKYN